MIPFNRIRAKVPLQELQVLPDGSFLRPNDSGYHETSIRANSQTIRTCAEGCSCYSQGGELDRPVNERRDTRTDKQTRREQDCGKILNVTQQEEKEEGVVQRRASDSSDGSYCDCNFCLQNGVDVSQQPNDPIQRFREMREVPGTSCQMTATEQTDRSLYQTTRIEEDSYSNQVSRFRDTHQENSLNSDDSMASSMTSFNCQDDIIASSPLSHDVTNTCDDVTNRCDDVTNLANRASQHDDTSLTLGSLMLLPAETPPVLGRPVQGLTDSLMVVGSNSHVTRLSDSEEET